MEQLVYKVQLALKEHREPMAHKAHKVLMEHKVQQVHHLHGKVIGAHLLYTVLMM
jgi:hypothetical protein